MTDVSSISDSFNVFTLDNNITDFDFDPTGEVMATFDRKSGALIADVNMSQCNFHLLVGDDKCKLKLKQDDLSSFQH